MEYIEYSVKPCPGCGGQAEWDVAFINRGRWQDHTQEFFVRCKKCGLWTKRYKTEKEAQEAWNKRVKDV